MILTHALRNSIVLRGNVNKEQEGQAKQPLPLFHYHMYVQHGDQFFLFAFSSLRNLSFLLSDWTTQAIALLLLLARRLEMAGIPHF